MNDGNIHAGLSGHTFWELLDDKGRTLQSGDHHNLITNAGLDAFGTTWARALYMPYEGLLHTYFGAWRQYLHLGTGSAEPVATGTAIDGEVSVSNWHGGFDGDMHFNVDTTPNSYRAVSRHVRVQDFSQARNLTNYGFSANGGAVSIWEKFRQPDGTPIVLTVEPGQRLKVVHDLTITLPRGFGPVVTRNMPGVGDVSGRAGFWTPDGPRTQMFTEIFSPIGVENQLFGQILTAADDFNTAALPALGAGVGVSVASYVAGSCRVRKSFVFEASQANGPVYGLRMYNSNMQDAGFRLGLTSGPILKDDTKRLTFDFDVTWGRA